METSLHEVYPKFTVLASAGLTLSTYLAGGMILWPLGGLWVAAYGLLAVWIQFKVLRDSCRHCYYYGKACGLGLGVLCPLFFKKGSPEIFARKTVTWKQLLPELTVLALPLAAGLYQNVRGFSWRLLGWMLFLMVLATAGNGWVRGVLVCPHCRQRELGCPAEKLFQNKTV